MGILRLGQEMLKETNRGARITRVYLKRLSEFVNILPDATFAIDLEGTVIAWNHKAEEMTGVKAKDIIGKGNHAYSVPFYGQARPIIIDLVLRPNEEEEKRYPFLKREKDIVVGESYAPALKAHIWGRATLLLDQDKNKIGALEIIRDITARKESEEELDRHRVHLEDLVKQRTSELEIEIEQRKKMQDDLELANKELESFSYSVSHDLRAPLRSIDGFTQCIVEDCATEMAVQCQDYLHRIRIATKRMAQLIEAILNFSRILKVQMNPQNVDLSEMASTIAAELKATQPKRDVNFIIQPNLITKGDPALLQVVMENLIGNSWKFTSNHPHATIEAGSKNQNNRTVFYVRDDGAGFDMAYAGKLFNPFQRLHTSKEFSGSGIGLATVQRIVHRHGGRVWAEGKVEQGATIYFTLNIKDEA